MKNTKVLYFLKSYFIRSIISWKERNLKDCAVWKMKNQTQGVKSLTQVSWHLAAKLTEVVKKKSSGQTPTPEAQLHQPDKSFSPTGPLLCAIDMMIVLTSCGGSCTNTNSSACHLVTAQTVFGIILIILTFEAECGHFLWEPSSKWS